MAIYKPTYCYPYGGNVDFCVDPDTKAIYLQCKLNTSNKKVTGYKLVLADNEGNTIWEGSYITPISSLSQVDYGDRKSEDHGEGFNGDTLVIPFVQNWQSISATGYGYLNPNCLYTNIDASVDYFITSTSTAYNDIKNLDEVKDWNNSFDNSYMIGLGELFVKKNGSANSYTTYMMTTGGLSTTGVPNREIISDSAKNFYIKNGLNNHNTVWNFTSTTGIQVTNWLSYISEISSSTVELKSLNSSIVINNQYSWKIILYQGDVTVTETTISSCTLDDASFTPPVSVTSGLKFVSGAYSEQYSINQYDILITQGQILGSTGERLQIYPADVVIQNYYVQLGEATYNNNHVITGWEPYGTRANIQIYDSSYGHIYPESGAFKEDLLEQNPNINACIVYKHSNDPDDNLETDMVRAATPSNLNPTAIQDILFHIFNGELMQIDGVSLKDGDLVLLKDLTGYEYFNGVYAVSSELGGWKRSGSYQEWAQFLGKIILVKEGNTNRYQNFQSQAQAGGRIGTTTGVGVDANHPQSAMAIFKANTDLTSNYVPTQFALWDYYGGGWHQEGGFQIEELIESYGGQYVLMFSNNDTAGSCPLYKYYIPSTATSFSDFNLYTLSNNDIIAIKQLTPSFGFLTISISGSQWTWIINNLNTDQKGSELFFIPEQPVILYPKYENLINIPVNQDISLVYIGESIQNSSNILTYELKGFTGSTDLSNDKISLSNIQKIQIDNKDLTLGDNFLGMYTYISGGNYQTTDTVQYVVKQSEFNVTGGSINGNLKIYGIVLSSGVYIPNNSSSEIISIVGKNVTVLEYTSGGSWNYAFYAGIYGGGGKATTIRFDTDSAITPLTKIMINKAPSSSTSAVAIANSTNINLIATEEAGIKHYYFGYFTVGYISSSTMNLTFYKYSGYTGSYPNATAIPNNFFTVKEGKILGGQDILTVGTYESSQIQYGFTNRVGILNINNKDITYIKPSSNVCANQYMVFTEVQEPERRIIAPASMTDDKEYGVQFSSMLKAPTILNVGSLFINRLTDLYVLEQIEPGYLVWSGHDSLGAPISTAYTYPDFNLVGYGYHSNIYNNSDLSEGTEESPGIVGDITRISDTYSSVTNTSARTPYKYKIMSYFKESDYNPIIYGGDAKIGFAYISSGSYQYTTVTMLSPIENQSFVLDNTIYTVEVDQQITFASDTSEILLRGYYQQGSGKRWEYYRMAIFDENGILLQDTGNIYDGDFSQYFWGLRPNNNSANTKYAILIVEDEFGKIYTTGVKLYFTACPDNLPYTLSSIQYNYNLQSVDIHLEVGSAYYTLYRKEVNSTKGYEIVDHFPFGGDDRAWKVRDYNITNNRKYVYYLNQDNSSRKLTPLGTGEIATMGKCWSLAELYPIDLPADMEHSLTIKKKYYVDENNVWLFKYNGEFGSQTQNLAKSEQNTLGKYPRIGQGMRNSLTGSVSCLLGSEIVPGQLEENNLKIKGYQERLRSARYDNAGTPTRTLISSNNSIDMLNAWRTFVQSKNPKLLKDVKGQSWIVQVTSNQNTPMSHVQGQPDSISFSWTQIGDPSDMIITGDIDRTLLSDH